MLTPEYLDSCTDVLLGMYDNLQTSIAEDIAKSIAKYGSVTDPARWQAERLQASGMVMQDVVQTVSDLTPYTSREIEYMFRSAAVKGMNNDAEPLIKAGLLKDSELALSSDMLSVLEATIQKTQGDLRNLALTTGSTAYNLYLEQTNLAYMKVQSGAYSYQDAIVAAIKGAAQEGSWVLYGQRANGSYIRSRLDVAVRRSVLTGINQTCGKLTEMLAEDLDAEYYEVSAHLGARPSHQEWQGQVYQINGSSAHYKNFYDATGYGTGDGLCGYNCRHSFYPFWPGISTRAYSTAKLNEYANKSYEVNGQTLTEYECSQTQRAYERSIRASKRVLASCDAAMDATSDESLKAALQEEFDKESAVLHSTEQDMEKFCAATNRRIDSARTQVVAYKDASGRVVSFVEGSAG